MDSWVVFNMGRHFIHVWHWHFSRWQHVWIRYITVFYWHYIFWCNGTCHSDSKLCILLYTVYNSTLKSMSHYNVLVLLPSHLIHWPVVLSFVTPSPSPFDHRCPVLVQLLHHLSPLSSGRLSLFSSSLIMFLLPPTAFSVFFFRPCSLFPVFAPIQLWGARLKITSGIVSTYLLSPGDWPFTPSTFLQYHVLLFYWNLKAAGDIPLVMNFARGWIKQHTRRQHILICISPLTDCIFNVLVLTECISFTFTWRTEKQSP